MGLGENQKSGSFHVWATNYGERHGESQTRGWGSSIGGVSNASPRFHPTLISPFLVGYTECVKGSTRPHVLWRLHGQFPDIRERVLRRYHTHAHYIQISDLV